jgi:hypothetical protein
MSLINNFFFIVLFALMALYGAYTIFKQTRLIRIERKYKDAIVAWDEPGGTGFRSDFPSWLGVNIHRGATLLLGLIALILLLSRPVPTDPFLSMNGIVSFIAFGILTVSIGLTGFIFGLMLAGPLAEIFAGARHHAMADTGLLALGYLWPWETFKSYTWDPIKSSLYLWSASLPGTVAFDIHAQSPDTMRELRSIVGRHLPAETEAPPLPRRYLFALLMGALCIPFLVASIVLWFVPVWVSLLTLSILMWLLLAAGTLLITKLIYANKGRPAAFQ